MLCPQPHALVAPAVNEFLTLVRIERKFILKPTETLMQEHLLIQEVLDALEHGAKKLGSGADLPQDFFTDAAEFIRGFADDTHHKKEEGVLFKAMANYGFSPDAGPVAVMLSEHDQARQFTQAFSEAAQKLRRGNQGAREDVIMYALSYVRHLRQHIMKENNILFPMANRVMPEDEQARIEANFERVERDEIGPGAHPKYEALAHKLRDQVS